ncbi:MAG TPA: helix-turn-helix domain-containing protein [Opitutaceae bacterium]|jgi:transcriptional regulator with XRE-family HTH domain|nr:helix-turn-helix domain-containing protein [Opitutaceae bacterium]
MQTIGERLEDARKRKGVSIREAAEATKIRGDYLTKFESNQFDFDLAEIYLRGFLRNYANYLKLPADRILDDYESLGRGESRARQPSREIYGRMDVSISSPEDRGDSPAGAASAVAAETGGRSGPQVRSHNSLPKTPPLDQALVFKGLIIGGCLVVALIVLWVVKSMVGGSSSSDRAVRAPAAAIASQPSLTLVALDTVHVVVTAQSDGRVLADTTLTPNQRSVVPRPGTVLIQADPPANLRLEVNGRRMQIPDGYNKVTLESTR